MNRIGQLERQYVLEALSNEFGTSKNSVFNARLEAAFAGLFGVDYAIGLVNGTATLHTAVAACGVARDEEVILPPLTMSSTALAVLQNGSIPVFADVDRETFNVSDIGVRSVLSDRSRALMTVALYGLPPDYAQLLATCEQNKIALIEDNAQCVLATYNRRLAGTFGAFSSFSFQASKHLTAGEGGMLLTNDEILADRARKFSSLGYAGVSSKKGKITREDIQDPQYARHVSLGFNYRMSEVSAAVALAQVERAQELVQMRVEVAALYAGAISGYSSASPQKTPANCTNSYWTYALCLNTDNPETDWYAFRRLFFKHGGDPYYAAWKLSYMEPFFQNEVQNLSGVTQRYEAGLCPNAEFLQPRLIQLKTNYWSLQDAQIQADALAKTLRDWEGR